eukprot:TRINITY_DN91009_c0_g1_i1.p1 TRINITY_DN91009_c0_g1~~TRINITY_DN91009_c0_g1_i1.p1  ORF type:complete len:1389 (-),score=341.99 TRINITY_DN91009_c0_g1_i1:74-4240(-)
MAQVLHVPQVPLLKLQQAPGGVPQSPEGCKGETVRSLKLPAFPTSGRGYGRCNTSQGGTPRDDAFAGTWRSNGSGRQMMTTPGSAISPRMNSTHGGKGWLPGSPKQTRKWFAAPRPASPGRQLNSALQALFQTYDLNRSGSVDLDEFVEGQADASAVTTGGQELFDRRELVAQYLEARTASGERQDGGGGLDFEGFADWQLRWQPHLARAGDEEAAEDCYRLDEGIHSRRSQCVQTETRQTTATWSSRSTRMTTPRWPPEAAITADIHAAEQRRRFPLPGRGFRGGGGMATVRKGFVQPPREVSQDIGDFEQEQDCGEVSSDDEAYLREKRAEMKRQEDEEKELRHIAEVDSSSARLACTLQRIKLDREKVQIPAQRRELGVEEEGVRKELQELIEDLAQRHIGKLEVWGRAAVRIDGSAKLGGVSEVKVALQELCGFATTEREKISLPTARSSGDGSFKLCADVPETTGGQPLLLVARDVGAADHFRRVGGQGRLRPGIEMLPFRAQGDFQAVPGSKDVQVLEDRETESRFSVPVGSLLKGGKPFAGQARLLALAVMPDFGSRARYDMKLNQRKDDPVELAHAARSAVAAGALTAVPERSGRTLGGTQVPLMISAAVFTRLVDVEDDVELAFMKGSGVTVQVQLHSLGREAITRAPSVWHFDPGSAEWQQTPWALAADGRELPSPVEPEEEARQVLTASNNQATREALDAGLKSRAAEECVAKLRAGQQAFVEELKADNRFTDDICFCGFRAKQAILQSLPHAHKHLRLAQPPKRLFAGVEKEDDMLRLCFQYANPEHVVCSTNRAAELPEVALSHHFSMLSRLLDPTPEMAKDMGISQNALFCEEHYAKVGKRILPPLRHVASYLVAGASVRDAATHQEVKEAGVVPIQLRALEFLVNCFIRPRCPASPPSSLQELWEFLTGHGGDIASSFILAALQQAQRDEIARTRKQLRRFDSKMWASCGEVRAMLKQAGPGKFARRTPSERAAMLLANAKFMKTRAYQLGFRQLVRGKMPEADCCPRPTGARLEAVLKDSEQRVVDLQVAAKEKKEAATAIHREALKASKAWKHANQRMREAARQSDPTTELAEERLARQAAALRKQKEAEAAKLDAESAAALEDIKLEQSLEAPARRLAEELMVNWEGRHAEDPEGTWQEVLAQCHVPRQEFGQPNNLSLSFTVQPGSWEAVAMPEASRSDAESTCQDDLAKTQEPSALCHIEEYFAPLPAPQRPAVHASSLVFGTFCGGRRGIVASEVACNSLGSCGTSWSQVRADGTFCLFALASTPFELWVIPAANATAATESLRFGPFLARSCDEATYLDVLDPVGASRAGEWRNPVTPASAYISLPRVETHGTEHERCTCRDASWLEGTATISEEASKELPGEDEE